MNIDFDSYQVFTDTTAGTFRDAVRKLVEEAFELEANVPGEGIALLCDVFELHYLAGKLNGEAGELAEQVFKATRDDGGRLTAERLQKIAKELGDVQWYIAQLARQTGHSLAFIAQMNQQKLQHRLDRNVLHGDGDDR